MRVLDITKFRTLPHGLIAADHPWATGINPATGKYVWHENVLFASPRVARTTTACRWTTSSSPRPASSSPTASA